MLRNKVLFLLILHFLISITQSSQSGFVPCEKYQPPKALYLRGHIDYYRQNHTGFPLKLDIPQLIQNAMMQFLSGDMFRQNFFSFISTLLPPFLFSVNTEKGFNIWGPIYSVIKEAAVYLNYTLEGFSVEKSSIINAAVKVNAKISMIPLFAHYTFIRIHLHDTAMRPAFMQNIPNFNMGELTRALGVARIDCIKYRKEFYGKSLSEFAFCFDRWIALAWTLSAIAISVILARFDLRAIWKALRGVVDPLFGMDYSRVRGRSHLLCLWIVVYWQLLADEMFIQLTKPAAEKVIDSWQDLHDNPKLKLLALSDVNAVGRGGTSMSFDYATQAYGTVDDYLNRKMPFYDDFTDRLTVISMVEQNKAGRYFPISDGEFLDFATFDGDSVLLSICDSLKYQMHNGFCGQASDWLHVSRSGGEMMPYFITTSPFVTAFENFVINDRLVKLTESGVYGKWLTTIVYNLKEERLKDPIFQYMQVETAGK